MHDTPLGLYIHVPFCTVKCSYCDFNSFAGIDDMQTEWEAAALTELSLWTPRLRGREISTVFIGGGTPSLLPGESIGRILDTIRAGLSLSPDVEITLEANPESVQPERLRFYRAAGVNRISMGVQSLDSSELVFLDRIHSAERAEAAFAEIRSAGFGNVNLDLIYGLPGQSLATWQSTLEQVLTWSGGGPDHISCYALTVEEGTPLAARVASGQVVEANPDYVAEIADWTAERLVQAGFEQYETSNYARKGLSCRHNLIYWRNQEYAAIGPGAHGFIDGLRFNVVRSPRVYIDRLRSEEPTSPGTEGLPSPAIAGAERVDELENVIDTLTSGLRLTEGVDETSLPPAYQQIRPILDWAVDNALAQRQEGRILLTRRGHAVANEVFVRLLETVNP
ncbi:MAG: radical SAM family heme chaperone HemW [Chloroflexi bacterium]|nr:radical SAM family heme chaperone HemW [Chloroflexota bacterium]MCY3587627.1 radical SAM family heme chaperone HemW [Chloroflexota bacterium]MCY3686408.1 radical SAM family heme chaperone HemW [Chloroflexota bacterium]MDE2708132.1 radical SAM family heme chaperone HemW [Chloroflexota bacterium]